MRDAQPSGGYPKIGTVIEADLWRLGQAPIGSRIRFVETTWAEAIAALDEVQAWLDEGRSASSTCTVLARKDADHATADELQQLAAWLAATDIGMLELREPGGAVRLRRNGGERSSEIAPAAR